MNSGLPWQLCTVPFFSLNLSFPGSAQWSFSGFHRHPALLQFLSVGSKPVAGIQDHMGRTYQQKNLCPILFNKNHISRFFCHMHELTTSFRDMSTKGALAPRKRISRKKPDIGISSPSHMKWFRRSNWLTFQQIPWQLFAVHFLKFSCHFVRWGFKIFVYNFARFHFMVSLAISHN